MLAVLRRSTHYHRIAGMIVELNEQKQDTTASVRRMLTEDGLSEIGKGSLAPLYDAYFVRAPAAGST